MTSILLIQTSSGYWDLLQGKSLPLPILHASSLAARKYDVHLLDLRSTFDRRRRVRRFLERTEPFLVGLTVMIGPQIPQAIALSRAVKAARPEAKVVWGGVFPSLSPEIVLSEGSVDYVVAGEGEQTLLDLADSIAEGGTPGDVPNVFVRDGEEGARGELGSDWLDLDGLPPLPYDLLPLDEYRSQVRKGVALSLETSRGCPHDCAYCYSAAFCRRRWRARSPDRTEEDMIRLQRTFGGHQVFFMDDNFFVDRDRAMAIAERAARLGLEWGTHGLTPGDATRFELADLTELHRTGLHDLKIGLENVSSRFMDSMDKSFDADGFRRFNRLLARFDIAVEYSVIFGIPGETWADRRKNIDYVFTLLRENPHARLFMINLLFPFPGTRVYEQHTPQSWKQRWDLRRYGEFEISAAGGPWLIDDEFRALRAVNFASLFVSAKTVGHSRRPRRLFDRVRGIYSPVARYRLEKLAFRAAPEVTAGMALLDRIARYLR